MVDDLVLVTLNLIGMAEVRAMMEDQIVTLQKEQDRLEQLSTREQKDRGLFGWLG
jgi:hypothetical protein